MSIAVMKIAVTYATATARLGVRRRRSTGGAGGQRVASPVTDVF
jgi:hypothetical protein